MKQVILLGDSITQGLGSKKVNFTAKLQEILGPQYEVDNLAYTGTTIYYGNKLVDGGRIPDGSKVVILYGNVDAQIRPCSTGRVFKWIPKRFQQGGMLMPRPFYSHIFWKSFLQRCDNLIRKILSFIIKRFDGTEQWVHLDDFTVAYSQLIDELRRRRCDIICCSTIFIDGKLFPGTPAEYEQYNKAIHSISVRNQLTYIDLYGLFERLVARDGWDCLYNHDHFHPNCNGYDIIASLIGDAVGKLDEGMVRCASLFSQIS